MPTRFDIEKIVPENDEIYDVIVAGGGPAGLGAALASSRNGARTLLLESSSAFGGVAAAALWMPVNRMLLDGGSRGGVHELFVSKLKQLGADAFVEGKKNFIYDGALDVHPDYLQLAVFELLEEAGCHYRLYSPVTDAIMDGNEVRGVVVTGKEGRQKFLAKVVIDATGDGDVAYLAGAEMIKEGRQETGNLLPISLVFALSNVDIEKFMQFITPNRDKLMEIVNRSKSEGYVVSDFYAFDRTTIPGVINVNNGGISGIGNEDGTKARDLTVTQRLGIQVAIDFVRIARENKIPGMEDCFLMRTGLGVGVRETRRIVGEYVLTLEDSQTAPDFPDIISRRYGAIDDIYFHGEMKSGYGYPYRCMLPKKIENLLAAGKCGSATHMGFAAGRSMGNMMGIGQAAGVAAALCGKSGVKPRNVDIKQVQDILVSMGVKLFN